MEKGCCISTDPNLTPHPYNHYGVSSPQPSSFTVGDFGSVTFYLPSLLHKDVIVGKYWRKEWHFVYYLKLLSKGNVHTSNILIQKQNITFVLTIGGRKFLGNC